MKSEIIQTKNILEKKNLNKEDLIYLLSADTENAKLIFEKAGQIKKKYVGNITYFRGLIEMSNICKKNCLYCGIRKANKNTERYTLTDKTISEMINFAYTNNYGSVVIQAGERTDTKFIQKIENILKNTDKLYNSKLGITLSLGEQTKETYQKWKAAGASRYLLRIETSNRDLYYKIHPKNKNHDFDKRMQALFDLKNTGYQTGTGVMIGLPFQTTEHLADDIIFFKEYDADMIGMGPYIEHSDTPLFELSEKLMPLKNRFFLSLKMIAVLRIFMKNINIAASTAMQTIDPLGREKAINCGANIIMPNITPAQFRKNYLLYQNKPCTDENPDDCLNCLENRISLAGDSVGLGQKGDSPHFFARSEKK